MGKVRAVSTYSRKHLMASLARSWSVRAPTPQPELKARGRPGARALRSHDPVSLGSLLSNWAALIALGAVPYLTLLEFLRLDAARSPLLQWSLVAVGALGLGSLLYIARRASRDPSLRARHGLQARDRANSRRAA